jgi:uncharacterized protein (TIGR03435 family)
MSRTIPVAVILAVGATAWGQLGEGSFNFEVASVRPAGPLPPAPFQPMRGGPGTDDPGRIVYTSVHLKTLLINSYGVKDRRISGPAWIDTERYDIGAKLPAGTTKDQFNVMMQNLLKERFHLALHRQFKELPVYELVLGKDGSKLQDAEPAQAEPQAEPKKTVQPVREPGAITPRRDPDGFTYSPPGSFTYEVVAGLVRMNGRMLPSSRVADIVEWALDRPVLDKTGLTGKYSFKIEFSASGLARLAGSPDSRPADGTPSGGKTLSAVLEDQLGLKLVSTKGPVEYLVIDRIDKTPTEN